MQSSRARNTGKAYGHCWNCFARWCSDAGRRPLPATPETLCLYVTWCLQEKGLRLATVRLRLCAIVDGHRAAGLPSPKDASVLAVLRSAARRLKERRRCKSALTPDKLARICSSLDLSTAAGARDRAVHVLGFAFGLAAQ